MKCPRAMSLFNEMLSIFKIFKSATPEPSCSTLKMYIKNLKHNRPFTPQSQYWEITGKRRCNTVTNYMKAPFRASGPSWRHILHKNSTLNPFFWLDHNLNSFGAPVIILQFHAQMTAVKKFYLWLPLSVTSRASEKIRLCCSWCFFHKY